MELSGKLEAKYETKEFASGFRKREFVINTGGDYPQAIKLEAHKDNIKKLDKILQQHCCLENRHRSIYAKLNTRSSRRGCRPALLRLG